MSQTIALSIGAFIGFGFTITFAFCILPYLTGQYILADGGYKA